MSYHQHGRSVHKDQASDFQIARQAAACRGQGVDRRMPFPSPSRRQRKFGPPMKNILDTPPLWLILAIIIAWVQARFASMGLSLASNITDLMSGLLIGGGLLLIALAAMEFRKARTTILPHHTPDKIITSGIFSRSRNPIYLGDALILAGLILRFDAVLSLVLVPIFVWWIERHFIIPEEDRMRRVFRADYGRYEQKVRRWV